jgi:hypothetical protein
VKPARLLYIKKKEIVSTSQGKQICGVAYRSRKVAEDFEVSFMAQKIIYSGFLSFSSDCFGAQMAVHGVKKGSP